MKRGDRLLVLRTERRGEMVGIARDGRVLVRFDGDHDPVAFDPHALEVSWVADSIP
jgi:hypothetical protein